MYVGLCDYDIIIDGSKKHWIPSLELMKISSYYKQSGVAQFMKDLTNSEKYDKIYMYQNWPAFQMKDRIPPLANAVNFGHFFYRGYSPLPPEIDSVNPDYTIYQPFLASDFKSGRIFSKTKLSEILNCRACFRLSDNDGHPLADYEKFLKADFTTCALWDENLFSLPADKIAPVLEKLKGKKAYFMYPQQYTVIPPVIKLFEQTTVCTWFTIKTPPHKYDYQYAWSYCGTVDQIKENPKWLKLNLKYRYLSLRYTRFRGESDIDYCENNIRMLMPTIIYMYQQGTRPWIEPPPYNLEGQTPYYMSLLQDFALYFGHWPDFKKYYNITFFKFTMKNYCVLSKLAYRGLKPVFTALSWEDYVDNKFVDTEIRKID